MAILSKKKELRSFKKILGFYFLMNFHEKELKMLRMIMASIVTYLEMKKNYRKVNKIRKLDRVMQNQKNCLCFKKILDFYFLTNLHEKGLKMLEMIMVSIVTYLEMKKKYRKVNKFRKLDRVMQNQKNCEASKRFSIFIF